MDSFRLLKLIDELTDEAVAMFEAREYESEKEKNTAIKQVKEICHSIEADEVRRLIIEDKVRPDGRKINEIRPLDSQVDLLPRTHGSAMFTRGETQVLSVTTLGAINDNQIIDDLTEVDTKRFMHHYNFPPYSVGETGRMGSPGRREIGHGALGERALLQVLPSLEEFPYTINSYSCGSFRVKRILITGVHLCRNNVFDGCRCTDQSSCCGYSHGTYHGREQR